MNMTIGLSFHHQLSAIKYSWEISHLRLELVYNVLETVPATSIILTQLISWEDLIA